MAIKAAELFSVDPAHAFDFAPVAPAEIFNRGLAPRVNQLFNDFMPEDVDQPEAAAPSSYASAEAAFTPEQDSFLTPQQIPSELPPDPTGSVASPIAPEEETPDFSTPISERYDDPADFTFGVEAQRDSKGRLSVYAPPSGDGGGAFEVAGITAKHQPEEAARLRDMVNAGKTQEAEAAAKQFYRQRAAPYVRYTGNPGLQLQIADSVHHRGEGGLRRILQRATGSDAKDYEELIGALNEAPDPLNAFHSARQDYEWEEVDRGRSSRKKFRKGLQNRFNKANAAARQLLSGQ